jgi:hypothetical protein
MNFLLHQNNQRNYEDDNDNDKVNGNRTLTNNICTK